MDYVWNSGVYRCSKITDRNGNYVNVYYTAYGDLASVVDTLGRQIFINYETMHHPSSITQTWKDTNGSGSNVTHTYATFSYTTKTLALDFDSSLYIFGPPNGTVLTVLDKITYADGSYTKFTYNGYGQVSKIENDAADSSFLNSVRTNLENPATGAQDCPRLTQTKTNIANFNSGNDVVTDNTFAPGKTYTLPGGITGTATRL